MTIGKETHMMPRAEYARITLAIAATKRDPQQPAATDTMNLRRQWDRHAIPRIYGMQRLPEQVG